MNCEEANKVDLVEYLYASGFKPAKIRGNNYWYISPLRDEKEASFKIDRNKNVWYDHGAGKGGTAVDFVMKYFKCDVQGALQKLSSYIQIPQRQFALTEKVSSDIAHGMDQQELFIKESKTFNKERNTLHTPPFHLHENSLINHKDAAETAIQIIATKRPVSDLGLCRYLKQRKIDKTIADIYCHEVVFKFSNNDAKHTAIGFKNSAGGYELRSEYFKLSSSPKYVTYISNAEQNNDAKTSIKTNAERPLNDEKNINENVSRHSSIVSQKDILNNAFQTGLSHQNKEPLQTAKHRKSITVFEGFFDFLTYQTIHQKQTQPLTNFLILNSLDFFGRTLLLMEKHEHVHLYLDHDKAGRKCLDLALKLSSKYTDESSLYEGHKDLNDWVMNFGKLQ